MQAIFDEDMRSDGIERGRERAGEEVAGGAAASTSSAMPMPLQASPRHQLQPLPPRITFRPLDASSLPDLRALNAALFPVNYGPRIYEQALAAGGMSHGAFYGDGRGGGELVGAITVRLESGGGAGSGTSPPSSLFVSEDDENPSPIDDGLAKMYIMTVGVLSAWRGQGIGTALLSNALSMASADENLGAAYLHAHTSNAKAIAFYVEKFGFNRGKTVRGYYRRLNPPDAVVLWKGLGEKNGGAIEDRRTRTKR